MTARLNADQRSKVVHLLDDDVSVRRGLARLLQAAHFEDRIYAAPEEFLDEVRDTPNSFAVLDITMPHMTSRQVMATLKERNVRIPVIVLSARDDDESRQEAEVHGALLFIRKPVDARAFFDAIDWTMGNSTSLRRARANDEDRP